METNDTNNVSSVESSQELSELLQIRRDKLTHLQDSGHDPFEITTFPTDIHAADITQAFEQYEGKTLYLAGRIMSKRGMGKATFCDLADRSGKIQLYLRKDDVGEESYNEIKKLDIGDIAGVKGEVFRTHKGEISVKVFEFTLLSKSLLPLPEKFHGLKDTELRYRQRYVDLIVHPEVRDNFITRSKIITLIRRILDEKGYLEVETPVLHQIAGGGAARPFVTHHNTLDTDLYLRIALELHLKRLIVGGLERVYEIGRIFRNEGMSPKHNPEFTMIELYQAYTDYNGMMELAEQLVAGIAKELTGGYKINYQGKEIDLTPPWTRLSMADAVKKYTGVDFMSFDSDEEARKVLESLHLPFKPDFTWGKCLDTVFAERAEDKIINPTFITMHPVDVSPLAKRWKQNKRLTERFEIFCVGRELGNAFSELNDPIDQRERFVKQAEARAAGDEEANPLDEDFLTAMEYGMPPTGGMGIGIDRLVMLFTDAASIRDVLFFPTLRPSS